MYSQISSSDQSIMFYINYEECKLVNLCASFITKLSFILTMRNVNLLKKWIGMLIQWFYINYEECK